MSTQRAPLLRLTAAGLVLLLVAAGLVAGWSEEAVRIVVRWTAKSAVVLFCAAFAASSLHALRRSAVTRWLMVNRRRLGLSFALAHGLHLAALVALAVAFPHPFVDGLDAVTLGGGGLAYAFVLAMEATSNDAAVRRLGARRWRLLHTVGGWWIALVFANSYVGRTVVDPVYAPFALLVVGTLGLRIARTLRARGGARLPAEPPLHGSPGSPGSPLA